MTRASSEILRTRLRRSRTSALATLLALTAAASAATPAFAKSAHSVRESDSATRSLAAESSGPAPIRETETGYARFYAPLMSLLPPNFVRPDWNAVALTLENLRNTGSSGIDSRDLPSLFWRRLGEESPRELPGFEALRHYLTGRNEAGVPYFQLVNDELRAMATRTDEGTTLVREIRANLERLPAYLGVVVRGEVVPDSLFARDFVPGNIVVNKGFFTASLSAVAAMNLARATFPTHSEQALAGRTQTIMIIRARHGGRIISYLDPKFDGEADVLFPNGTPLEVVAVSPKLDVVGLGPARIVVLEESN